MGKRCVCVCKSVYCKKTTGNKAKHLCLPLSSAQRSSSTKMRIYKQFKRHEHKTTLISWKLTAVGLHSKYCMYLRYNCSSEAIPTSVFIIAYPSDMYSIIKTVPFWSWKFIKITHKIIWIMKEACKPDQYLSLCSLPENIPQPFSTVCVCLR